MMDGLAAFSWVLVAHAIVKSEQADVRMTDAVGGNNKKHEAERL